jgi:hypothetical protein
MTPSLLRDRRRLLPSLESRNALLNDTGASNNVTSFG